MAENKNPAQDQKKDKSIENDIFVLDKVFVNPRQAFTFRQPRIETLAEDCLFVLDTNCLLSPYSLSVEPIQDVDQLYRQLAGKNRLFVPTRAAREFARNRHTVLTELFNRLYKLKSSYPSIPELPDLPMLEEVDSHQQLLATREKVKDAVAEMSRAVDALMKKIRDWDWADKISTLYDDVFIEETLIGPGISDDDALEKMRFDSFHKIPPGFKDKNKLDEGIGDYLIWLTILHLGKIKQKDVLFVTNETKIDWTDHTQKTTLAARSELLHRFYDFTGSHFGIVDYPRFLALVGAKQTTVEQAKNKKEMAARAIARTKSRLRTKRIIRDLLRQMEMNFFELSNINSLGSEKANAINTSLRDSSTELGDLLAASQYMLPEVKAELSRFISLGRDAIKQVRKAYKNPPSLFQEGYTNLQERCSGLSRLAHEIAIKYFS